MQPRHFKLQKHFETLNKFDEDLINDLDFAIYGTLGLDYISDENQELIQTFTTLKRLIEESKTKCIIESKNIYNAKSPYRL